MLVIVSKQAEAVEKQGTDSALQPTEWPSHAAIPWSLTSNLQNCEIINVYGLGHPVCGYYGSPRKWLQPPPRTDWRASYNATLSTHTINRVIISCYPRIPEPQIWVVSWPSFFLLSQVADFSLITVRVGEGGNSRERAHCSLLQEANLQVSP